VTFKNCHYQTIDRALFFEASKWLRELKGMEDPFAPPLHSVPHWFFLFLTPLSALFAAGAGCMSSIVYQSHFLNAQSFHPSRKSERNSLGQSKYVGTKDFDGPLFLHPICLLGWTHVDDFLHGEKVLFFYCHAHMSLHIWIDMVGCR
jgi:hypothetical protein